MKKAIIFILYLCFLFAPIKTYGEFSIIQAMENSKDSVVEITSEMGSLFKSKPTAIKDAKTGRILLARKIGAAKYTRAGAGVIIDNSATIVTNAHTIEGAAKIKLAFNNGQTSTAKVIRSFPDEDIAFLRPTDRIEKIRPVVFSKPQNIKLRTRIFNIGYSETIKGVFSEGKITGIGQNMQDKNKDLVDLIQVSLSIYKGDSGGPLFDKNGDFIGLLVGALQKTSKASYAIPAPKIAKLYIKMISE